MAGANAIRCKACNHVNDVTAFACASCGASLVGAGADRWIEARSRDLVFEQDAEQSRSSSAALRRIVLVVVVVLAVTVAGWYVATWYTRNNYVLDAPQYDGHAPAYWADIMLTSEDHYMRRRAALALESICDRFNERTAHEIVPSLKRALNDEDDVVRNRARSALDKISATTGVTD